MPQRKQLSHKALITRLILSKKLTPSEQAAFDEMYQALNSGQDLTEHQKLWVESLRHRTDPV